jgi:hypothetical protein
MQTTSLVLGATVVVTGSTVIRDVHEGKTRAAPIVFGFMMAAALLIMGMGSEKLARGLSYMSMVGALAVNGPAVFAIASGISKSPSPGITGLGHTQTPFHRSAQGGADLGTQGASA